MGVEAWFIGISIAMAAASVAYSIYSYVNTPDGDTDEDEIFSWSGGKTIAKEDLPVPVIYGTCITKGIPVNVWIEQVTDEKQQLNMLLAVCEGEVDATSRTDIDGESTDGFEKIWINGQESTEFFPANVSSNVFSGTAGGTSNTTTVVNVAFDQWGEFLDRIIYFADIGAGERRVITAVNPVTLSLSVSPAFGASTANEDFVIEDFCVIKNNSDEVNHWIRLPDVLPRLPRTPYSLCGFSWFERDVEDQEGRIQFTQDAGSDSDDGYYDYEGYIESSDHSKEVVTGAADSGTTATSIKDASLFVYDDHFNTFSLKMTSGTYAGEVAIIKDVNGTAGTAALAGTGLTGAPSAADKFIILVPDGYVCFQEKIRLAEVYTGTTNEIAGYSVSPEGGMDYRYGTETQSAIGKFDELHSTISVSSDLDDKDDTHEYTTTLTDCHRLRLGFIIRCFDTSPSNGEGLGWEGVTFKLQWKKNDGVDSYDTTRQKVVKFGNRTSQNLLKIVTIGPTELRQNGTTEDAQFKLKVDRRTDKSDAEHTRELTWAWVDEVEDRGLTYPHTALIAFRKIATEKLSGNVPDITVRVRRKVRDYTATTTDMELTGVNTVNSVPAWCMLDMLTDKRYGAGNQLERVAGSCDTSSVVGTIYDTSLFIRDDEFNDMIIEFLSGALDGKAARISDTSKAGTITLDPALSTGPAVSPVITGTVDSATDFQIVDTALFTANDTYNNKMIELTSGAISGEQSRIIDTIFTVTGAADRTSTDTSIIDTSLFNWDDEYNTYALEFTSGTLNTESQTISDVVGSTGTATTGAFTGAPAEGDTFKITMGVVRVHPVFSATPANGVTFAIKDRFEIVKDVAISDFQTLATFENDTGDASERWQMCELTYDRQRRVVDRLSEFLASYGMRILWQDSYLSAVQDKSKSSSFSFDATERDEGGSDNINVNTFEVTYADFWSTPNILDGRYLSRTDDYFMTPIRAVDYTDLMASELLSEKVKATELMGITRKSEAFRRIVQLINKARLEKLSVRFSTNAGAVAVEVGDVIDITHSEWGFVDKDFMVYEITITENGEVQGVLAGEHSAAMYAWDDLTVVQDDQVRLPNPAMPPGKVTNLQLSSDSFGLHVAYTPPNETTNLWGKAIIKLSESFRGPYFTAGSDNDGDFTYPAVIPGITYYVRVYSVSRFDVWNMSPVRGSIMIGGDTGDQGRYLPQVSHLEIEGQGEDTGFVGGRIKFAWIAVDLLTGSDELGSDDRDNEPGNSAGQGFMSYVVKVYDVGESSFDVTGAADATSDATNIVDTSLFGLNDEYNGMMLEFTSGTLSGESQAITDTIAASGKVVTTAFSGAPGVGDTFTITVRITAPRLQRTEVVRDPYWEYRPEDAKADFGGVAPTTFVVKVWAADDRGRFSRDPAHIRVSHDGSKLPVITGVDIEAGYRKMNISWDERPESYVKYDVHVFGKTASETDFTIIAKSNSNTGKVEGTLDATGYTHTSRLLKDTQRTEANDYWNGSLLRTQVTIGGRLRWRKKIVSDFASGVFSMVPDFPAAPAASAEYQVGTFHKTETTPESTFTGPQDQDYLVKVLARDDYGVGDTASDAELFDQIGDSLRVYMTGPPTQFFDGPVWTQSGLAIDSAAGGNHQNDRHWWLQDSGDLKIYYARINADGTTEISTSHGSNPLINRVCRAWDMGVVFDSQHSQHVVTIDNASQDVYWGRWEDAAVGTNIVTVGIADASLYSSRNYLGGCNCEVDSNDAVCIVAASGGGLFFGKIDRAGNKQTGFNPNMAAITGTAGLSLTMPSMTIDADDNIHIAARDNSNNIYYFQVDNGGSVLIAPKVVFSGVNNALSAGPILQQSTVGIPSLQLFFLTDDATIRHGILDFAGNIMGFPVGKISSSEYVYTPHDVSVDSNNTMVMALSALKGEGYDAFLMEFQIEAVKTSVEAQYWQNAP